MKFELKVGFSQGLKLNRKILQALYLLQQSQMELKQTVQQALETNIMLEEDLPAPADGEKPQNDTTNDEPVMSEGISEQLPIDTAWEDLSNDTAPTIGNNENRVDASIDASSLYSRDKSLHEHLREQVQYLNLDDIEQLTALAIIDAIDDNGYLSEPLEGLARMFANFVSMHQMEGVLARIQGLDPPGVGARTAQECLKIQLLQLSQEKHDKSQIDDAMLLVDQVMNLLVGKQIARIADYFGWGAARTGGAVGLIRSLQPHPGAAYESSPTRYAVPEVFVRREKDRWKVELNHKHIPRLRINPGYAAHITRGSKDPSQSSLKSHLQEAKWFIENLRSRAEVVLQVSTCIVRHQENFLKFGEEAMRPLILEDVAREIGVHISTVSRATGGKYMDTPQGVYPFKFFFPSQIRTEYASGTSSTAVKALIKKIIASENSAKPLSDSDILMSLDQRGIKIARRTVAKYREAMSIPARKDRRRPINT